MTEESSINLTRTLYSLAFLLFALRFLWLGDTVYILDEAFIQMRIDEHFAAGTIPLSNSRGSSIPLPYGPGAQWFYMLLRLFTWHPVALAFAHLTVQTMGVFLFLRAITKAYGREAGAWCALLLASSPILFFYARHTWDNTLLIPLGALIIWLLQKLRAGGHEFALHAALGCAAGYALNIHLMFGPAALALGVTLLLIDFRKYRWKKWRPWALTLTFGCGALLVLAPYLIEATRIVLAEKPFEHARNESHWGDGRHVWWLFLRTALHSSLFAARAQLDDVREQFFPYAGSFISFFYKKDFFGWFGKIAAWGGALAVLFNLCRLRVTDDALRLYAALAFFFMILVNEYLNIPMAAHYFHPVWWFVFLGVAFAITGLRGWWKRLFLLSIACCIAVNVSYIVLAMAYIHENKGARNMETSVVVSEQMRNLRELCAWGTGKGRTEVRVFKDAIMGEPAFDFLPKHMPECQGISVRLVPALSGADFHLHHPLDSITSAALVADPTAKP
ncbi:MAG TPA: hypothetical protein VIH99_07770 [Bdellovibrionota bacterium]|jgi:hypothetical protein